MAKTYEKERRIALTAVTNACKLCRALQTRQTTTSAQSKADASPVTIADYAVQASIITKLQQNFPGDSFIAEETTTALRQDTDLCASVIEATALSKQAIYKAIDACAHPIDQPTRTWILDPIDGTRGFIASRQYCVALGLLVAGRIVLGVLGCPSLPVAGMLVRSTTTGTVFHAVRGSGCYMATETDLAGMQPDPLAPIPGTRVFVSDVVDPLWSVMCESVESGHSRHALSAGIAAELGLTTPPVRMDSMAKYGCIARGDASIFLRFPKEGYVENVWDVAPAAIIVEEAGGMVTDGRGDQLNFGKGRTVDNVDGIVVTNGAIHSLVIDAVQKVLHA